MKKSVFRVTLCIVLIAAIAVLAVGCNNTKSDEIQQVPTTVQALMNQKTGK